MIQSSNLMASLLAVVFVATSGTDAAVCHVGNSAGWVVPHGHVDHYKHWAAGYKFHVGDTLVFNFAKGMHDVARVTKAEYEACDGKKASETIMDGPAKVKLHSPGEHYFICTFPDHCKNGQRLAVNVHGSPSPAPSPKSSSRKIAHAPSSAPTPGSDDEGSPSEAPTPGSERSPSEAHSEAPSPKGKRSMSEDSPSEAPATAPGSGESPSPSEEEPIQGSADYRK